MYSTAAEYIRRKLLSRTAHRFLFVFRCICKNCPLLVPRLKHRPPPREPFLVCEERERSFELVRRPAGRGRANRWRKFGAWLYRFLTVGAVAVIRLSNIAGFCRSRFEVFGCGLRFCPALDACRQFGWAFVFNVSRFVSLRFVISAAADGGFVSQNRLIVAS